MEDWTEKYRPNTLNEIIGNKQSILDIKNWAELWIKSIPRKRALIISGKPGIGKTSCAHALAKNYGWSIIELNASDARNSKRIKEVATAGAINETFNEDGGYFSYNDGGRKIIILDEADNLYEKTNKTNISKNEFSDIGGKKAIIDTITITNHPIILIVNDYYELVKGAGDSLRKNCKLVKFYPPHTKSVYNHLKKICLNENITIDDEVLQTICDRCLGDIRSSLNDLQSISLNNNYINKNNIKYLGNRDREKIIFDLLRYVFKYQNIKITKEILLNLNVDPQNILLWLNENIPYEYKDLRDLLNGYKSLSKSDIFLGRANNTKNYRFWSYACDIMTGGVSYAKKHKYNNNTYIFPTYLKSFKKNKQERDILESIVNKISNKCHNSKFKSRKFLNNYFINTFRNNIDFAISMRYKLNLTEREIKYLLGEKYLKNIEKILTSEYESKNKILTKELTIIENDIKIEKNKNQQSLFDF